MRRMTVAVGALGDAGDMPLDAISEPVLRHVPADEDVEVFDGHTWRFGTLAEWRLYESVGWVGWVRWNAGPGENRIGTFLAVDIRKGTSPGQESPG